MHSDRGDLAGEAGTTRPASWGSGRVPCLDLVKAMWYLLVTAARMWSGISQ